MQRSVQRRVTAQARGSLVIPTRTIHSHSLPMPAMLRWGCSAGRSEENKRTCGGRQGDAKYNIPCSQCTMQDCDRAAIDSGSI